MKLKNKIYISLPIQGQEKTVKRRYNEAVQDWIAMNSKGEVPMYAELVMTGPCNIDRFDDNGIKEEREHSWEWYLGEDVKILLGCDTIYMCRGYEASRGCMLELAIAKHMGINVVYQE